MMILSISATYPAPNGCRIIRPRDRSCWLLRLPNGRTVQYPTRRLAEAAAESPVIR